MANLTNDREKTGKFNYSGDDDSFYITFDEDGYANFWAYPSGNENTDMKMYVYEEGSLIGRASNVGKSNRNVLLSQERVRANREYKIKLRHVSGPTGEYTVKAKNYPSGGGSGDKEFDLGIRDILYRNDSGDYVDADDGIRFEIGKEIKFKIEVKNYKKTDSPKYKVVVYDKNGRELDYDNESSLEPKDTENAYLYVTVDDPGEQKLKFKIIPRESNWDETDSSDNKETRTFIWGNDNSSYDFDLGITDIEADKSEPFKVGNEVEFTVKVKNYERNLDSPRYRVVLEDMNGNQLDYDNEPSVAPRDTNNAYVATTIRTDDINSEGKVELRFRIVARDDQYTDTDNDDNDKVREYNVIGTGSGLKISDLGTLTYIRLIESIKESSSGIIGALNWMKCDFESFEEEDIKDFKRNYDREFNRFCQKFNELIKESGLIREEKKLSPSGNYVITELIIEDDFEEFHYFRNKLNRAPDTLDELIEEKDKWEMLPFYKAAFHMSGDDGIFNLKFVSKDGQHHEAVYNKEGKLLTEKNDYINMGTYNYIGPDDADGHILYDVKPFYKWGNVSNTGRGDLKELKIAGENIGKFLLSDWISKEAQNNYNEYVHKFGLPMITGDETHQPW